MTERAELRRSITLPFLVLYGMGTMVGAGFYALLGEVAGEAGLYTPIAMAFSGLLALVSAFSFAELSSRFPFSAGEARYVQEAFGRKTLGTAVGWLVILTGVVSASTLSVATIQFLQDFVEISPYVAIPVLVLSMGFIAAWGIGESVGVVTVITVVEIGALVYVFFVASSSLADVPQRLPELVPPADPAIWTGIFSGGFLAFYAFIGFEDMVNMAEEVKDVRRTLPTAILVTIMLTTLLYVIVSLAAVLAVSPSRLASSNTPVAEIVSGRGWYATTGLRVVSLFAALNGALVQVIMASRVAYGLANKNQAPRWLGAVHPKTQTPLHATVVMTAVILALATFFPLGTLARATSTIMLVIFASVNFALFQVKKRDPDLDGLGPRIPRWLPLIGTCACILVLLFQTLL